jgi:hypothetical protein
MYKQPKLFIKMEFFGKNFLENFGTFWKILFFLDILFF